MTTEKSRTSQPEDSALKGKESFLSYFLNFCYFFILLCKGEDWIPAPQLPGTGTAECQLRALLRTALHSVAIAVRLAAGWLPATFSYQQRSRYQLGSFHRSRTRQIPLSIKKKPNKICLFADTDQRQQTQFAEGSVSVGLLNSSGAFLFSPHWPSTPGGHPLRTPSVGRTQHRLKHPKADNSQPRWALCSRPGGSSSHSNGSQVAPRAATAKAERNKISFMLRRSGERGYKKLLGRVCSVSAFLTPHPPPA